VKILQDYAVRSVLTIAGSDSSGGAGIQADLRTFAACGVHGLSAITAVTAQNTRGVHRVDPVSVDMVIAQIDAAAADVAIAATKIGMLATRGIVDAVASAIVRLALKNVVLDTVMAATAGGALLDPPGIDALRVRLLPLADIVTPNLAEAETLTGLRVRTLADARLAAEAIGRLGARAVIVTGGHLNGPPTDVLWTDGTFTELTGDRVDARVSRGTGCMFSAALAARLAEGDRLTDAARAAKAYVTLVLGGQVLN
jgi:hydroxymethylpyrimidine/phosphomethylpyrimidine kinase